jgi:hypothetical protein
LIQQQAQLRREQEQATADLETCTDEAKAVSLLAKATVAKNKLRALEPEIAKAESAVAAAKQEVAAVKMVAVTERMDTARAEMERKFDELWTATKQFSTANDERRTLFVVGGGDPSTVPEDQFGDIVLQYVHQIAVVMGFVQQVGAYGQETWTKR